MINATLVVFITLLNHVARESHILQLLLTLLFLKLALALSEGSSVRSF